MRRLFFIFMLFGLMQGPVPKTVMIDGPTSKNLLRYIGHSETIVINEGTGGGVLAMYKVIAKLQYNDTNVVINGPCFSSCVLLLASPKVTFTENADFYVHSSYDAVCENNFLRINMSPSTNDQMLMLYADNTAYWIVQNRAFEHTDLVMIPEHVIMQDYASKFRHSVYKPNGYFYGYSFKMGRTC